MKGLKISPNLFLITLFFFVLINTSCLTGIATSAERAREAEVAANIHMIEIALERYAVDTGGVYPSFLIGAERDNNIVANYINCSDNGVSRFPRHGMTPFIFGRSEESGSSEYIFTCDPLIQFGYLAEYPQNPFALEDAKKFSAKEFSTRSQTGMFPYGGLKGDKMFDLGFGWGDTPQTEFFSSNNNSTGPVLDAPGNFYYHPVFNDRVPPYFHCAGLYNQLLTGDDAFLVIYGISSQEVMAYYLYGYGRPVNLNGTTLLERDYFASMPFRDDLPEGSLVTDFLPDGLVLDSSVREAGEKGRIVESTGYPDAEYDPWAVLFADGIDPNDPNVKLREMSGPDGITDWVSIELKPRPAQIGSSSLIEDELMFAE